MSIFQAILHFTVSIVSGIPF